jgi:cyclic-di-GMP phosphodiesterase TipF (flagellum assembly factor)
MAEITGEIALLGGLVRDLAVGVAAGERAVADLQAARSAPPRAQAEALPARREEARPRPVPAAPVPTPSAPVPAPRILPVQEALPREAPAREAPAHEPPLREPPLESPPPRAAADAVRVVADPRGAEVVAALRADRIEVHLQPVVALPQRKVRFYEALAYLRGPDDAAFAPAESGPALEAAGLTPELDAKMVARAAAIARHLAARGSEGLVAIALAPASLRAPGFLRALGRVLESHPDVLGRLVLSVSQRCWRNLDAEAAGALGALRARGVAFALDRATDLRLDPLALADRGVRFAKLPADLLLRPVQGEASDYAMADLATVLARAGIRLVAEGVEREGDVPDLIELDVPLAQGGVFAPPRALRADVLGGAAPKPAAAPPAAPEPPREKPGISILPASAAGTGERVPLRSLLRRAL